MNTHETTCWVSLVENRSNHLDFTSMDVGVCKVKEGDSFLEIETENVELAKELEKNMKDEDWEISVQGQSYEYVFDIQTFEKKFEWFKEEFPQGPGIHYGYRHKGKLYVIKAIHNPFPGANREIPQEECSFIRWDSIEQVRVIAHSSWYEKGNGFKVEVEGKNVRMEGLNPLTCEMELHFKVKGREEEIECSDYIIDEMSVLRGM